MRIFGALAMLLGSVQDKPVEATFKTQDGKEVRLSDFRGKKPVVLLFMRGFTGEFACHFCGLQTREYKANFDRFREAGAEVLMVLPGAKDAQGYLKMIGESDDEHPEPDFSVPYSVVLDADLSGTRTFQIPCDGLDKGQPFPVSTPATVVIAKDGAVAYRYQGKVPKDRPSADQILQFLKTGKAPEMAGDEKPAPPLPGVAWKNPADGFKEAKDGKKPVLIDFYADW